MKKITVFMALLSCSVISSFAQTKTGSASGTINGHEYVDLGLSVKWATCNVGAYSPSDYGNYYAWGETSPKFDYKLENSTLFNVYIDFIKGNAKYDAAKANWGGTWRLPTNKEIDELINKCTWEKIKLNGHNGYRVIGLNGNSIFLPAAGSRVRTSLCFDGEEGYYWGAMSDEGDTQGAYDICYGESGIERCWFHRYFGQSVRPVSE